MTNRLSKKSKNWTSTTSWDFWLYGPIQKKRVQTANSTNSNLRVQLLPQKFFQTTTRESFSRQGVVRLQVRLRSIKMSFKCWNKNSSKTLNHQTIASYASGWQSRERKCLTERTHTSVESTSSGCSHSPSGCWRPVRVPGAASPKAPAASLATPYLWYEACHVARIF